LAVVVTIAKGYDLSYIWKTQDHAAEHAPGGYYMNAAQAGEPPGRWWGPGAQALGLTPGQTVERQPYDAVYRQLDPRTGARVGRARGRYPTSKFGNRASGSCWHCRPPRGRRGIPPCSPGDRMGCQGSPPFPAMGVTIRVDNPRGG
jgi:hypothetical protein